MGRSQPAGNSLQYLPSGLGESLSRLLEASLAPSTRAHYQRAWGKLVTFFQSLGMYPSLPIPVAMILLFVAHLHASGAAPATIVSNVSALAYFHKINGLPDPTSNFIVVKLLAGARNIGSVPDVRVPVTLPILSCLVQALPTVFASTYTCTMLRAMMVIAFRAYLRVGEMVPRSRNMTQGCLHVGDVTLTGDLINVSFRRFKHSARHGPQSLQVRGECLEGSLIHPAAFLREFIQARGPVQGILFGYPDGSPMLRGEFDVSLKRLLSFCGYKSSAFKGHSFRIGAATAAALRGESDAQIRAAGRWSSDAFSKYIRIA